MHSALEIVLWTGSFNSAQRKLNNIEKKNDLAFYTTPDPWTTFLFGWTEFNQLPNPLRDWAIQRSGVAQNHKRTIWRPSSLLVHSTLGPRLTRLIFFWKVMLWEPYYHPLHNVIVLKIWTIIGNSTMGNHVRRRPSVIHMLLLESVYAMWRYKFSICATNFLGSNLWDCKSRLYEYLGPEVQ